MVELYGGFGEIYVLMHTQQQWIYILHYGDVVCAESRAFDDQFEQIQVVGYPSYSQRQGLSGAIVLAHRLWVSE